jgi:two-component system, NarL family, sensor histidine kinase UhpB
MWLSISSMSLRIRLTFIISLLFLCSMLLGLTFLVLSARQRVANEVASTATLTYQLLNLLLPGPSSSTGAADHEALLLQLAALDGARHMEISIARSLASPQAVDGNLQTHPPAGTPRPPAAPRWFASLVRGEDLVLKRALGNGSGDIITIRTQQADEIDEVWQETRVFLVLLGLVLLLLNGILFHIIGRWLTPVHAILDSLEDVENGGSATPLPSKALPELRVIADRVESLGEVLRLSRAENERLMGRSLRIQEQERRHMAQELHDEMGQSISAIKAIACSIAERNREDTMSREGAERIGTISNNVRDHIRSMMQRLHPSVLDELGLIAALEYMVDEWNRDHANVFCSLRSGGEPQQRLDSEQEIHLYRIVQEALTNVAAHAMASRVDVTLELGEQLVLTIHDDGRGFDAAKVPRGMGLSGMQERVKALDGEWQLDTAPGAGVTIQVTLRCKLRQPHE